MGIINFLKTHKMSVLSSLLVVAAALLGADLGFAMAVEPVELATPGNPSDNMNPYDASTNPLGRAAADEAGALPSGEALQRDEQGGKTQLQNKAATATDVRDAGLEAEDYDKDVDEFRPFAFPIETYIARQCRPVKVNSPVHGHWRTGSTDLDAVFNGIGDVPGDLAITAGSNTSKTIGGSSVVVYNYQKALLKIPVSSFDNPECLTEFSTVIVKGVAGYKKADDGSEVADGELMLFVLDHKDSSEFIQFKVINPPFNTTGSPTSVTISMNSEFKSAATACAESQMHVASETYLPEKFDVFLQKKIVTCVITDALEEQIKKVPHTKQKILANAEYNFKRECARSHWNGTKARVDVYVPETGNRESVYFENGILRQLNMLYTLSGNVLTDDDLLVMSTLMFTDNSQSDEATVFCGKKAMQRLIKLVNSADKYKDVGRVEVNDYGIKVRNYRDNFGSFEFIYDPTLNDIGYEEAMVAVDLRHATRPYMVNKKTTTRDMSKTGEAREAKEYNLCKYDCVALNGFNSMLVLPANAALIQANLGGIQASFQSVSALPSGSDLTDAAKLLKYFLTADDTDAGFKKGDIVEWNFDLNTWDKFQGMVRA